MGTSTRRTGAERLGFRGVVGENIQYGAISPQEAVKRLLTSPGHGENLMDARWKLFGGAVANGTADTLCPGLPPQK